MAEELKLSKFDNRPWGFRLVGGQDFSTPLTVVKVIQGSVGEQAGLRVGDILIALNDQPLHVLTHWEAHETLINAGNNFVLSVIRNSPSSPQLASAASPISNAKPHGTIQTQDLHGVPQAVRELSIEEQFEKLYSEELHQTEKTFQQFPGAHQQLTNLGVLEESPGFSPYQEISTRDESNLRVIPHTTQSEQQFESAQIEEAKRVIDHKLHEEKDLYPNVPEQQFIQQIQSSDTQHQGQQQICLQQTQQQQNEQQQWLQQQELRMGQLHGQQLSEGEPQPQQMSQEVELECQQQEEQLLQHQQQELEQLQLQKQQQMEQELLLQQQEQQQQEFQNQQQREQEQLMQQQELQQQELQQLQHIEQEQLLQQQQVELQQQELLQQEQQQEFLQQQSQQEQLLQQQQVELQSQELLQQQTQQDQQLQQQEQLLEKQQQELQQQQLLQQHQQQQEQILHQQQQLLQQQQREIQQQQQQQQWLQEQQILIQQQLEVQQQQLQFQNKQIETQQQQQGQKLVQQKVQSEPQQPKENTQLQSQSVEQRKKVQQQQQPRQNTIQQKIQSEPQLQQQKINPGHQPQNLPVEKTKLQHLKERSIAENSVQPDQPTSDSLSQAPEVQQNKQKQQFMVQQPTPPAMSSALEGSLPEEIFSEEYIAEIMSGNAEVIMGKAIGVNFHKFQKNFDNLGSSSVLQLLQEEEKSKKQTAQKY